MISFSTSWNAKRRDNAEDLIEEIKGLGFGSLELNFTLSKEMVEEIACFVKKGAIEITSIHNYCPMPEGFSADEASPDLFSIASKDLEERRQGIEYTKHTIDTASMLGAQAVVVHAGKVDMGHSGKELKECYLKNPHSRGYLALKKDMVKERAAKSAAHLKMALASISEILRYAKKYDIKIGIETRYYINEVPSIEEIGIILNNFGDSGIFYWHDIGHAYVQERMGLAKSSDYLKAYGARMLGVHIHDVRGIQDHIAPLTGEVNFARFTPFLHNGLIKVIEVHHQVHAADIVKAKLYLEGLWRKE